MRRQRLVRARAGHDDRARAAAGAREHAQAARRERAQVEHERVQAHGARSRAERLSDGDVARRVRLVRPWHARRALRHARGAREQVHHDGAAARAGQLPAPLAHRVWELGDHVLHCRAPRSLPSSLHGDLRAPGLLRRHHRGYTRGLGVVRRTPQLAGRRGGVEGIGGVEPTAHVVRQRPLNVARAHRSKRWRRHGWGGAHRRPTHRCSCHGRHGWVGASRPPTLHCSRHGSVTTGRRRWRDWRGGVVAPSRSGRGAARDGGHVTATAVLVAATIAAALALHKARARHRRRAGGGQQGGRGAS